MIRAFGLLGALAAGLLLASGAGATTITLSQVSSDETPAGQLDATLDFTINSSQTPGNLATLVLTLTNTTGAGGDPTFNINEIGFNGSGDISTLSLISTTAGGTWGLGSGKMDGFGSYEFKLTGGTPIPGSVTFTLEINGGIGDYDMADFVGFDTFSTNPPGNISAQAALKFVQCVDGTSTICTEDDDSAFGAANGAGFPPAPEPGLALLLAAGAAGLVVARRR